MIRNLARLPIPAVLLLAAVPASPQSVCPRPLTQPLACPKSDCTLLAGAPQTTGMRSGFVRLQPGESMDWHTTGTNEESLVILRGAGEVLFEGQPNRAFAAPAFAYVPPATRHSVRNTGTETLEYVYVVAPAKVER